ncbi:MAG: YwaF family protein [Clostridia bacterium]|nr:YwaF family protein [Clostridia bacterium]
MIYLVCLGTIVLFTALYGIFRKALAKHTSLLLKIAAIAVFLVFFVRYYASSGSLLDGVVGLSEGNPFEGEALPFGAGAVCSIVTVDVWLEIASVVVVVIYPFFPKQRVFRNFAKTFTMVFSVINIVLLRWAAFSFTGNYELNTCSVCMAVEAGLVFCMCLHALYCGGGFKLTRQEFGETMYVLPVVLIFTVMPYMPQTLFGNFGYMRTEGFEVYHRGYLYCAAAFMIVMYFYLRGKDAEYVRMVLLYAALAAMITYCYRYDYTSIYTISEWPLHLCNAVMFLVPICLIFKWDWLFYFTFLMTAIGAVFAMLFPTYGTSTGALSTPCVAYWQNHIMALGLPTVMLLLGVYKRPKIKNFLYSLIGFLVYYLVVTFVNAYLGTDFFFTSGTEITSMLGGFGEWMRGFAPSFTAGGRELVFYPVYQSLTFVAYAVLAFLTWLVYVYVFHLQDIYRKEENRNREIRTEEWAIRQRYEKKDLASCRNEATLDRIEVRHIYKRYDGAEVYAVSDASIEVKAGEILGFLGPNGAGKSTIIKCIVGIHPATKGSVEINGYDMAVQEVEAKSQIGFVPDHYALHEKLTGREYLNYVADIYRVPEKTRDERIEGLIRKLGMTDSIDSRIETYSHGMKQKMAIMAGLIHNPKALILDEPLTGLDPTSVYQVKECMREHAARGNIVFFSSHLIDVVEKLCTRIIIIGNGRILESADMEKLQATGADLEKYYLEVTGRTAGAEREKAEEEKKEEDRLDFLFRKKAESGEAV